MVEEYITRNERSSCEHCQWEIFPGQIFYLNPESPDVGGHFDKQECIDSWKAEQIKHGHDVVKNLKFVERRYTFDPDHSE